MAEVGVTTDVLDLASFCDNDEDSSSREKARRDVVGTTGEHRPRNEVELLAGQEAQPADVFRNDGENARMEVLGFPPLISPGRKTTRSIPAIVNRIAVHPALYVKKKNT
jgi:hypothetical protein